MNSIGDRGSETIFVYVSVGVLSGTSQPCLAIFIPRLFRSDSDDALHLEESAVDAVDCELWSSDPVVFTCAAVAIVLATRNSFR